MEEISGTLEEGNWGAEHFNSFVFPLGEEQNQSLIKMNNVQGGFDEKGVFWEEDIPESIYYEETDGSQGEQHQADSTEYEQKHNIELSNFCQAQYFVPNSGLTGDICNDSDSEEINENHRSEFESKALRGTNTFSIGESNIDTDPIGEPVLPPLIPVTPNVSPVTPSAVIAKTSYNVTFDPVIGASYYQLFESRTGSNYSIVATGSSRTIARKHDTTGFVYYKYAACNSQSECSGLSPYKRMYVYRELETPSPISPLGESTFVDGQEKNITYKWKPVADTTVYDLYIYDRVTRAVVFRDDDILHSACTNTVCQITPNVDLPISKDHVWRVRAKSPHFNSPFSYVKFHVKPEPVQISAPSTVKLGDKVSVVFNSSASGDYQLYEGGSHVKTSSNSPIEWAASKGQKSYTVRRCYNGICGDFGNSKTVNVYRELEKPTPIIPLNGSTFVDGEEKNITYKWKPVADTTEYDFYIYDRVTGATVFRNDKIPYSSCSSSVCQITPNVDLPISKDHVWRVRAKSPYFNSSFSHVVFHIQPRAVELT